MVVVMFVTAAAVPFVAAVVATVIAADLGNRIERVDLRGDLAGARIEGAAVIRLRPSRRSGEAKRGGEK